MSRAIDDGIHWIQYCVTVGPETDGGGGAGAPSNSRVEPLDKHAAQNAFLLVDEQTLLFETLPVLGRSKILDELDTLLDGRPLDFLVISHTDSPHCGNTRKILDEYPECTLLAPGYGQPDELYYLGHARSVEAGDRLNLGRFTIDFCEAVFLDAAKSIWMYERESRTLFCADWVGFTHTDGHCLNFVDEYRTEVDIERLIQFHARVFFWYQYVDAETVLADIDDIIDAYRPSIVAPSHGQVIRENAIEHLTNMKTVVETIHEQPPTITVR